jgi:hypothetical protein
MTIKAEVEAEAEEPPSDRAVTSAPVRARVLVPLYLALAAVVTWPMPLHAGTSLNYGAEPVATVPLFNLWTLRWNEIAIGDLFRHYWDAPLFHPTTGAFALSEPQPLTGLVFAPLAFLGRNPVLAFNLVLLAALTLNGIAGHRLARTLGAAVVPAAVTGGLAVSLPFVAAQLGVLQLVMVFPLLLLIDAVLRWAPDGGRRRAVEIGLWLAVTFLTCGYYGLFAAVVVFPSALVLMRRTWFSRARALDLAAAAGVFAILALPFLLPQARITSDYHRSAETIESLSADTADFLRLPEGSAGSHLVPWVQDPLDGHALYPGTVLVVLAIAGTVLAARRAAADPTATDRNRQTTFLLVGVMLAHLLSLGLNLDLGGWQPYQLVRRFVPGFESLRSPFRADVLTQLFAIALASYALDAAWRRLRAPGRAERIPQGVALGLAAGVVVLALAETGVTPGRLHRVDTTTPDWAAYLDDHPLAADPAVLAFMPFPPNGRAGSYQDTVDDMLAVLDTGDTTVNGYSGLFPATYDELEVAAREYPDDRADTLLAQYGVDALVVDRDWLDENAAAASSLDAGYRLLHEGPETVIYLPIQPARP